MCAPVNNALLHALVISLVPGSPYSASAMPPSFSISPSVISNYSEPAGEPAEVSNDSEPEDEPAVASSKSNPASDTAVA